MLRIFIALVVMAWGGAWGQDKITETPKPTILYASALAWSPDGTSIAYSYGPESCDGNRFPVLILDVSTGTTRRTLPIGDCNIHDLSWSPDGNRIAGASVDSIGFRVWDVRSGLLIAQNQIPGQGINSVNWHPSLDQLMLTSFGGVVVIFDAVSGEHVRSIVNGTNVDWNSDGSQFVTTEAGEIQIIDTATGAIELRIKTKEQYNYHLDWSADNSKIAAIVHDASPETKVQIRNAESGDVIRTLIVPNPRDISWDPHSRWLAIASGAGHVKIWDANTFRVVKSIYYADGVYALDWSPDGKKFAFAGMSMSGNPPELVFVDMTVRDTMPQPYLSEE